MHVENRGEHANWRLKVDARDRDSLWIEELADLKQVDENETDEVSVSAARPTRDEIKARQTNGTAFGKQHLKLPRSISLACAEHECFLFRTQRPLRVTSLILHSYR